MPSATTRCWAPVAQKKFHVYRVWSVEEGIGILTERPAGRPDADGRYPAGTVFGAVQAKLQAYLERAIRLRKAFDDAEQR